ncbi:hypothetical protein OGR47_06365 [Methylocystis sp. MJC1]|jgi:hypothetical protein|uniref:hypothetical protein n=1 Tax=Methylocystis sp. MJC1 TaxID=2654282 RepID=UPI0013EC203F|nr:hypothetical protein [Methylocystis sp. MJC1]KAF2992657.1 hypothetical protein MJC1_00235 [Methylocystis sp. MJC1]MBU6526623.1 hypothetical protein [Methylocystis sp. MJC1]UZX13065.1 hypothetical protein OGR47_06365 [Methylocystis sp. MJC1]
MMKSMPARALLAAILWGAPLAAAHASPFSCRLLEAEAFLPELSTFSGYRWIECRAVSDVVVDGVSINNGKCYAFDYGYTGRRFVAGQPIYVPYACMSPVTLAIAANGVITKLPLR